MCGRFEGRIDPTRLRYRYGIEGEVITYDFPPEYAPTMLAPVIVQGPAGMAVCQMKWGFPPVKPKAPVLFNAKAETAAEKRSFAMAFRERRCIVPATAFFEWRDEGKPRKAKYRFAVKDFEIFSLAGLWTEANSASGESELLFTILTTAPNDLVSQYHSRMPCILSPAQEPFWLLSNRHDDNAIGSVLNPYPADQMAVEAA